MKRSIMSVIAVVVILIGIFFVIGKDANSDTVKNTNTTYVVKVHAIGCDGCTGVTYCYDGGGTQTTNSCVITLDLTKGQHTICVHCPNNKIGVVTFTVTGNFLVQDVDVNVQNDNGLDCPCSNNK